MPFALAIDVDDDEEDGGQDEDENEYRVLQTVENDSEAQNSFFMQVKRIFNKNRVGESKRVNQGTSGANKQEYGLAPVPSTKLSSYTCECPRIDGVDFCCSKAYEWLHIIHQKDSLKTSSKNPAIHEDELKRMKTVYLQLTTLNELNDYEE